MRSYSRKYCNIDAQRIGSAVLANIALQLAPAEPMPVHPFQIFIPLALKRVSIANNNDHNMNG